MARFSEMLLNRRRQLGMSIQQVANVIKIRPQIIEYFENGEFTQMPPRGYAQGMISSYARYLGLNPREVIDAYFDDLYEFEKSARTQAGRYQGAVMESTPRSAAGSRVAPSRLAGTRGSGRPPQAGYLTDYEAVHGTDATRSLPRNAYAAAPSGTRRGAAAPGAGRATGQRGRQEGGGRSGRRAGSGTGAARRGGTGRASGRASSAGRRPVSGSRTARRGHPQGLDVDPRLIMAGAGVLLVLLIVLIVLAVRGCTAQPASDDGATAPAATAAAGSASASDADAGAADEDEGGADADDDAGAGDAAGADADADAGSDAGGVADDAADGQDAGADAAPEQTVMTVSVKDGASVWMEITVDGTAVYAAQTEGPFKQEYEPQESFEIRVDKSEAVTVQQNGEDLSFDRKSAGVSRITVEVPQPAADAAADTGDAADADTSGDGDQQ